jgi:transposase InsO family protein
MGDRVSVLQTSESTIYRILGENKQLRHRGRAKEPVKATPVVRVATKPRQIWSWDITYLRSPVKGSFYYLYLLMDVWSRKIVGFTVQEEEDGALAAKMIRRAALAEGVEPEELTIHSDNGGPMKASTLLATLQRLQITPSYSRPRVSDDNPFSEALFRTVKYRPDFPEPCFKNLETARQWVAAFVRWYNEEHLHSGVRFVTPTARHDGHDLELLAAREAVYATAKARHPERWGSRPTRNWTPPQRVCVRARRTKEEGDKRAA